MTGKSKTGVFYGWVILAASCVILSLGAGAQYTFGVFLTELCHDLGWTRTTVSGAFSLFMVVHALTYSVAGRLNDRYGPRAMVMISAVTMAVGFSLMSFVNAPWQLYVFYGIFVGAGMSFSYVPIASTIPRWFTAKRGLALGITRAGAGIGTLVMAPLAQYLISHFGWRASYLTIAALIFVIALPLSRLLRLNPSDKGLLPYGIEKIEAGDKQCDNSLPSMVDFTLKQAIKTKTFWLLFAMYTILYFVIKMVMVHLKAYATDVGITPMVGATLIGFLGGISIVGTITTGSLSDKIGRKACFFISYLLMAVMMLWLLKARQEWQFYLFSAFFGFGYGGSFILFPAAIGDWFGTKFHGSIYGTLSLAALGGAIGPLLAGYIFDTTGTYELAIIIGAVVLFIAMGLSLIIKAPDVRVT